jgi:transcriptional regulator with XRE-family HTH domain
MVGDDEASNAGQAMSVAARLGADIKRRRIEAGMTQAEVAKRVGYTRQYVSHAERVGEDFPSRDLTEALDSVLGADGALIRLRVEAAADQRDQRVKAVHGDGALSHGGAVGLAGAGLVASMAGREEVARLALAESPREDILLTSAERQSFLDGCLRGAAWSALNTEEQGHIFAALRDPYRYLNTSVIEYFDRQLKLCMTNDGDRGPRSTLNTALGILVAIEQSAPHVPAGVRQQLLTVAARGAEFVGWLYRDIHNPVLAGLWYDRATGWAQEAGDMPMQGYVLLRKSQMAFDERDAVRVLTLAQAAIQGPWQLPARVKAEAMQQEARGLAMTGEPMKDIERKLGEARRVLAEAGTADPTSQLGAGYDESTFRLRNASCYVEAGRPRQAAELYGQVLELNEMSRRDRGYFMARRASSLALAGEPDEAADVGIRAAELALVTRSLRTKRELARTVQILKPWSNRPGPRQLRTVVAGGVV